MFDHDVLDELDAVLGPANVTQLLARFAAELPTMVEAISRQVGAGAFDEARRSAHSLRGAALTIGAIVVALAAERVERAADADLAGLASSLASAVAETSASIGA